MNNNIFLKITSITAILFLSSTIYLSVFWSAFELNIFEFLSINQLILTGVGPIIDRVILTLFGWIIAVLLFDKIFPYGGYEKIKGEGALTKGLIIERNIVGVVAFIIYPISIVIGYFQSIEWFYKFLPSNFALYSFIFTNYLVRKRVISDEGLDVRLAPIYIFIIISSFSVAKLNSREIIKNTKFNYTINNSGYQKYIGKAGDYFFLKSLDNYETTIHSKENLKSIQLYRYDGVLKVESDSIIYSLTSKQ